MMAYMSRKEVLSPRDPFKLVNSCLNFVPNERANLFNASSHLVSPRNVNTSGRQPRGGTPTTPTLLAPIECISCKRHTVEVIINHFEVLCRKSDFTWFSINTTMKSLSCINGIFLHLSKKKISGAGFKWWLIMIIKKNWIV